LHRLPRRAERVRHRCEIRPVRRLWHLRLQPRLGWSERPRPLLPGRRQGRLLEDLPGRESKGAAAAAPFFVPVLRDTRTSPSFLRTNGWQIRESNAIPRPLAGGVGWAGNRTGIERTRPPPGPPAGGR